MELNKIYALAKALPYAEFKAEVARVVDNVPPTVECSNKYTVVNKNDLLHDVMRIVCPNCGCNKIQDDGGNYYTCLNMLCDFRGQITP